MCGSNSKTGSSSKESNKTSIEDMWSGPEDWMRNEGRGIFDKFKGLTDSPYQAYTGERVADYGPDFDTARNTILNTLNTPKDLHTARDTFQTLKDSINPNAAVSDVMNPYVDQIANKTISDMGRAQDGREHALDAQATAAGAFGDTGWGLARAESNRDFANEVGARSTAIRGQAFDKAMDQINRNKLLYDQLGQQFLGLDAYRTQRNSALAGYLDRFANERRGVDQMKDNVGYSDFLEQRDWGKNQLGQLMTMLNQTPHLTHSYGTKTEHGTETGQTKQSQPNTGGWQLLGKLGAMGLDAFLPGAGTALNLGMSAMGGGGGGGLGGLFGGGGDANADGNWGYGSGGYDTAPGSWGIE